MNEPVDYTFTDEDIIKEYRQKLRELVIIKINEGQ